MTTGSAPLRIGIDARYLSHGLVGGVHTYLTRLLPELIAAAPDDRFHLYADTKAPFELEAPVGVTVRTLPWRHPGSSVWTDWVRLQRAMARDRIDVGFFPANHGFGPAGAATVVTVHDALNLLPLAETFRPHGHARTPRSLLTAAYLKAATTASIRRATRIVTMSAYSRDTIVAACGRAPEDFAVVHHGAPPKIPVGAAEIAGVVAATGVRPPFVLADGLKNPSVLLEARERRRGDADPLSYVFFARHARVLPELAAAADRGAVRLLVRPSSAELAALYAAAAVFAFPSWVEGFGIPLLEAMTYGAPIVAAARGSIPEVAGPAAILFDPEDAGALAEALDRATDPAEAARLRAAGTERVRGFTWRRSAMQTLDAIHKAYRQVTGGSAEGA
ncbi:MAG: glycosyltransferase family 4 protein [Vicinamibacterales bacterium]